MPDLRLTFLGTGTSQGIPVIACECEVCRSIDPRDKRLRTSVMIETQGKTIVIDTGPDFRQQMLREQVKQLDAVVFTHEHKDHMAGMDDVRAFNFFQKRAMDIYASARVQESLKRDFHYAFSANPYPGVPQLNLHTIDWEPFSVAGVEFVPFEVLHHKLPVHAFRIGDCTYITDANYLSEESKGIANNSKVLVLNALRKKAHISHFTLDEALELIEELQPERAYLTHLSHQMGKHVDVSRLLPDNVEIAYDGLKVEV